MQNSVKIIARQSFLSQFRKERISAYRDIHLYRSGFYLKNSLFEQNKVFCI